MKKSDVKNITFGDTQASDLPDILDIYSYYVTATTVSLEESPPTLEEISKHWQDLTNKSLPYLIAKTDGRVVGYTYAFQYRPRTGYRYTLEESVYIRNGYEGLGIGYRLLSELIHQCHEKGYKQMLAVMAGDNHASITFHKNLGFRRVGVLEKFGYKFDRWLDTVLMQREL